MAGLWNAHLAFVGVALLALGAGVVADPSGTFTLPSDGATVCTEGSDPDRLYQIEWSGFYAFDEGSWADAFYEDTDGSGFEERHPSKRGVRLDDDFPFASFVWGPAVAPDHTYSIVRQGTGAPFCSKIADDEPSDNVGSVQMVVSDWGLPFSGSSYWFTPAGPEEILLANPSDAVDRAVIMTRDGTARVLTGIDIPAKSIVPWELILPSSSGHKDTYGVRLIVEGATQPTLANSVRSGCSCGTDILLAETDTMTIPREGSLGTEHTVLLPFRGGPSEGYAFEPWITVLITAPEDGTVVTIHSSADFYGGGALGAAIKKGETREYNLDSYGSIGLRTEKGEPSGTRISSNNPVAVSTHFYRFAADPTLAGNDVIRTEVRPIEVAGREHVVCAGTTINPDERHSIIISALSEPADVTILPAGTSLSLEAWQWQEVTIASDVVLSSSADVHVAHAILLHNTNWEPYAATTMVPPVSQWRATHNVGLPSTGATGLDQSFGAQVAGTHPFTYTGPGTKAISRPIDGTLHSCTTLLIGQLDDDGFAHVAGTTAIGVEMRAVRDLFDEDSTTSGTSISLWSLWDACSAPCTPPLTCPSLGTNDLSLQAGTSETFSLKILDPDEMGFTLAVEGTSIPFTFDAGTGKLAIDASARSPATYELSIEIEGTAPECKELASLWIDVQPATACPRFSPPPKDTYELYVGESWPWRFPVIPPAVATATADVPFAEITFDVGDMQFDWTPTKTQQGTHELVLMVQPSKSTCSTFTHEMTVTVQSIETEEVEGIACPTLVLAPSELEVVIGNTLVEPFRVASPDGIAWALRAPDAPRTLAMDENGGILRWYPDSPGTYHVLLSLVAYDPSCDQEHKLTIIVYPPPARCPKLNGHQSTFRLVSGSSVEHIWSVDDPDDHKFELEFLAPQSFVSGYGAQKDNKPHTTTASELPVTLVATTIAPGTYGGGYVKVTATDCEVVEEPFIIEVLAKPAPTPEPTPEPKQNQTAARIDTGGEKVVTTPTESPPSPGRAEPEDRYWPWLIPVVLLVGLIAWALARRR